MNKIVSFTRPNIKRVQAEIDKALAAIGERHGIQIKTGAGNFSPTSVKLKLEMAVISDGGVAKTPGRVALELHYPQYVDKIVTVNGKQGKVVEYHSKKWKNPFIVETLNRKDKYKVPEHVVA